MNRNKIQSEITLDLLKSVSFEQFKLFLDSLNKEKKTWSLDLQNFKNEKDFYENIGTCFLSMHKNDIIGLISIYTDHKMKTFDISFLVKKEYQGIGIGTMMISLLEINLINQGYFGYKLIAKHYKDNIASMKAFNKAGWENNYSITGSKLIYRFKEIKDYK